MYYIVLETFWASEDLYHPNIITDTEGKVLKFDTQEEAENFAKEECQKGLVVKIN